MPGPAILAILARTDATDLPNPFAKSWTEDNPPSTSVAKSSDSSLVQATLIAPCQVVHRAEGAGIYQRTKTVVSHRQAIDGVNVNPGFIVLWHDIPLDNFHGQDV